MWEVTNENITLLESWIEEHGNNDLKRKVDLWSKKKPIALDFDELNSVLLPLENDFPIYRFIEKLRVYKPVIKKTVDPAYKARIEKLRFEQENREYMEMTRSIDPSQHYGAPQLMGSFGEELKTVNRQLVAVFNTLLTVGGAFFFGFFGINFAYPDLHLSIASRMVIGLVLGTVVFIADLYFIVKGMGDEKPQPPKTSKKAKSRVQVAQNLPQKTDSSVPERMNKEGSTARPNATAKLRSKRAKKAD